MARSDGTLYFQITISIFSKNRRYSQGVKLVIVSENKHGMLEDLDKRLPLGSKVVLQRSSSSYTTLMIQWRRTAEEVHPSEAWVALQSPHLHRVKLPVPLSTQEMCITCWGYTIHSHKHACTCWISAAKPERYVKRNLQPDNTQQDRACIHAYICTDWEH